MITHRVILKIWYDHIRNIHFTDNQEEIMSTRLPEGFLWGGATADFQFEGGFNEGGRGILSHDYETDGSQENPRHHTFRMQDGSIIKPASSQIRCVGLKTEPI